MIKLQDEIAKTCKMLLWTQCALRKLYRRRPARSVRVPSIYPPLTQKVKMRLSFIHGGLGSNPNI